jgi:hypothetical protein
VASWEGYVIENLTTKFQDYNFFCRTASGDELDLILENVINELPLNVRFHRRKVYQKVYGTHL